MNNQLQKCFNCKNTSSKYFCFNKNNYCYFCKLVYFLEPSDVFFIHIGYSMVEQDEIVRKTKDAITKENRIPSHKEIDPNSKLLKVNPYIFLNLVKLMSQPEQICFANIKIFFSQNIDINLIKIRRIIDKPIKFVKSTDVSIFVDILPHQKLLYNKYFTKYVNENTMKKYL